VGHEASLTQEERCSLDRLGALAASRFGEMRSLAAG
jgi:hypothetical protein